MTSKVLVIDDLLTKDHLATAISEMWIDLDSRRQVWKNDKEEILRYIFATDTTQTTNSKLPWKNKTTIPKLCQIRDNLYANYSATAFQNRKWLTWEADNKDDNSKAKRDAILNYMTWAIDQPQFMHEMDKIILDYIDYGNCFGTVEWLDQRVDQGNGIQSGFVGPSIRRISPLDIVMLPTAESFITAPKIIRSVINLGELKDMLEKMSNDQNREDYQKLWDYLKDVRSNATEFSGDMVVKDKLFSIEGFVDFRSYLGSDYAEVLTFYGDIYDSDNDEFLKNQVITVVDRHKLINKKPNPSYFGYPPIFHSPWRKRQDNLWGMGPLDNLVGMQYRLDHIENMKADIFDLVTYPVQKVRGFVEDFTWQPGEKIYVSEEGDVELLVPNVNVLSANNEIMNLQREMEEMAGAPREAMGFRTPGEKTKYEVQSLENAASRVFQNKIKQFEEQIIEPLLNAMLELARRNMTGVATIKVTGSEFNTAIFQDLTVEDITGIGRIKPIAARHFAEQAQLVQNLTNLTNSNLWPTVQPHFSSITLAQILEEAFDLKDYEAVIKDIAIVEQMEMQKFAQSLQEQAAVQTTTASGIGDDFDLEKLGPQAQIGQPPQPGPQGL